MEKITIDDIKDLGFTRVEKVINTGLQLSDEGIRKIIKFNEQNDYEYTIIYDEHNLVDSGNIIALIRHDYIMSVRGGIGATDSLVFKHKYLVDREKGVK
jgi:hypothetical protein